jgi:hypothetical protein
MFVAHSELLNIETRRGQWGTVGQGPDGIPATNKKNSFRKPFWLKVFGYDSRMRLFTNAVKGLCDSQSLTADAKGSSQYQDHVTSNDIMQDMQ